MTINLFHIEKQQHQQIITQLLPNVEYKLPNKKSKANIERTE